MSAAGLLLLGACTSGDDSGTGLIDTDDPTGSEDAWVLTIEGPDDTESGDYSVETGEVATGFVAHLETAGGDPVADEYITLTVSNGTIDAPPSESNTGGDDTDDDGDVDFSYEAPSGITSTTTVDIVASVDLPSSQGGGTLEETFTVEIDPPSAPELTFAGPKNVAPGVTNSGYTVTVTKASTGAAIADACVTLTASLGTISPSASTTCDSGLNGWVASDLGVVSFSLTPPTDVDSDTDLTLTASSQVNSVTGSASYTVTVLPDTFQFTSPSTNTSIEVGSDEKQQLEFQWTRDAETSSGAVGVAGNVVLTTDSSDARFLVGSSATTGSSSVTVATSASSSGNFTKSVYIYDTVGESVTVTATSESTGNETTLLLDFYDEPTEINLDATPLVIEPSPSTSRFSTLTATVLNQVGEPISGAQVTFTLVSGTYGTGEQVFPTVAQTNSSGQASSRYEAGTLEGTASIQVTTENGVTSNTRVITVSSSD